MIRVKKMKEYLKDRLGLGPNSIVWLYHQDKRLDDNVTLVTIKQIFSKGIGDIIIHYQYSFVQ